MRRSEADALEPNSKTTLNSCKTTLTPLSHSVQFSSMIGIIQIRIRVIRAIRGKSHSVCLGHRPVMTYYELL